MNSIKKIIIGLLFIGAGAVIILSNLGYIEPAIKRIVISWQMACIAIGLIAAVDRNYVVGAVLMSVGVYFITPLIPGLELGAEFVRNFWPFVLIVIGVIIIISRNKVTEVKTECRGPHVNIDSEDGYINWNFCFNGLNQTFTGPVFKGGRIQSFCGGVNLDLTKTRLPDNEDAVLTLRCFCGGASIRVPENWRVEIRNRSFLGGATDNSSTDAVRDSATSLIINVECFLGGAEIKR